MCKLIHGAAVGGLAGLAGRGLGETLIGKLMTRTSRYVDRPREKSKKYEDSCVPCEFSPKAGLSKKNFKNQVNQNQVEQDAPFFGYQLVPQWSLLHTHSCIGFLFTTFMFSTIPVQS